jgi:protein-tyrosine-phosphatase
MKILFVCTGNTCRSPMAQALAANLFGEGYEVASAGVMAMQGSAASAHAISAMLERELDIAAHKSQMLNKELIEWADLVLAMTAGHKSAINSILQSEKAYTIGEYSGMNISVSDPYGGNLQVYLDCAQEIYNLLLQIKEKILDE